MVRLPQRHSYRWVANLLVLDVVKPPAVGGLDRVGNDEPAQVECLLAGDRQILLDGGSLNRDLAAARPMTITAAFLDTGDSVLFAGSRS